MTRTTKSFAAVLLAIAVGAAALSAHARVSVMAVGAEVTQQGSIATAKFKIQVTNEEDVAINAVRVVFDGGIEVVIGDVAAGSTVVSGGQKFVFDTTNLPPTRSFPVPVTVKFLLNGE